VSWLASSLAIDVAVGSTSLGVGRLGDSSFRSLSFFIDGSIYYYTLLVLVVSCIIKNHWIQLDGWLRITLIFDSLVVVILEFDWVRKGPGQGLASVLAKPYFNVSNFWFDSSVRRRSGTFVDWGRSSVRLIGEEARDTAKVIEVVTSWMR